MKIWKRANIFSVGEISPDLFHRTDLPQYQAGLRKLVNGYAKVEGTITNCPDLEIKQENIGTASSENFRLFTYNVDDRNDYKGILMIMDTTHLKLYKISINNTFEFKKSFDVSYKAEDISKISMAQIENTVMICCKGYKPNMIRVEESAVENSVLVNYWEAIVDPPVKPIKAEYENAVVGDFGGQWNRPKYSNTVVIETTQNTKIFSDAFVSKLTNGQLSIYGNLYRIQSAVNSGVKTTFTLLPIDADAIGVPSVDDNNKPKWENISIKKITFLESLFVGNKYPALCSYYQGRLVFGNIQGNPDFLCFSKSGDYFKFSGSVKHADSGFTLAIPSDERAIITSLISWNSLVITTNIGIWSTPIIQSITPTNSFLTRQMIPNFADIETQFTVSEGALYYVNYSKNKVFTLLYNYDSKVYQAEEISSFSNFMLRKGIQDISKFKYEGDDYIACDMGSYYAMCTINRQQGVTSWNRYTKDRDYKTINLNNTTIFIYRTPEGVVNSKVLSYNVFKDDMVIELLPPILADESLQTGGLPYIARSQYQIGNARVAVIGNYDLEVNGQSKPYSLGHNKELPKVIQFDLINAGQLFGDFVPLTIKNKNKEKVEISAVYYTVESEKEVV